MTITLTKIADGSQLDVTPYLDESQDLIVVLERQRKRFQRVHSDVNVVLSNLDGTTFAFFEGIASKSRYRVTISSGSRNIFIGEVFTPSLKLSIRDEKIRFTSYSNTKIFWDWAKKHRVVRFNADAPYTEYQPTFATVEILIKREVSSWRFPGLFDGYSIAPLYVNRPIRWYKNADRSIGNEGRYRDLDPQTTVADLLEAMSIYYNAEFFIDPVTNQFMMIRRSDLIDDRRTNLNAILKDDDDIEVTMIDDEKVDWIFIPTLTPKAAGKPVVDSLGLIPQEDPDQSGLYHAGRYRWVMTYVFEAGGLRVEGRASDSEEVRLPVHISIGTPGTGHGTRNFRVTLQIPTTTLPFIVSRKLYRTKSWAEDFFLVTEFPENTTTEYTDRIPDANLGDKLGDELQPGIWISYDETTGTWSSTTIEDLNGESQPEGVVLNVGPKLTFLDSQNVNVGVYNIDRNGNLGYCITKEANGLNVGDSITFQGTDVRHSLGDDWKLDGAVCEVAEVIDTVTFLFSGFIPTTGNYPSNAFLYRNPEKQEQTIPKDVFDVISFFGKEFDINAFSNQWIELFLTKRKVKGSVKTIDVALGDSFESDASIPNDLTADPRLVLYRGSINLMKEDTEVELRTI